MVTVKLYIRLLPPFHKPDIVLYKSDHALFYALLPNVTQDPAGKHFRLVNPALGTKARRWSEPFYWVMMPIGGPSKPPLGSICHQLFPQLYDVADLQLFECTPAVSADGRNIKLQALSQFAGADTGHNIFHNFDFPV